MMRFCVSAVLVFSLLAVSGEAYSQREFPDLKGPYLGQKPPGLIPELFAPGIISTKDLEIEGVFSPNMDEFFHVRQREGERPKIHIIRYENGVWQAPVEEARTGEILSLIHI